MFLTRRIHGLYSDEKQIAVGNFLDVKGPEDEIKQSSAAPLI